MSCYHHRNNPKPKKGVYRPLLLHPNPAIQNETNPAIQIKTLHGSNSMLIKKLFAKTHEAAEDAMRSQIDQL